MSIAVAHPQFEATAPAVTRQPVSQFWLLGAGAVLLLGYGPLLWTFFSQQWEKPHYQYFPFVIAAFAWLLWERFRSRAPKPAGAERPTWVDVVLAIVASALLLIAIGIFSPWCAMLSLILLAATMCRAISRIRTVTNLWGIWFLLCLIIPVPFNFDQRLTKSLQLASSKLSSYVLDWFGVYHLMEGNTLWLHSKQLFVDEACSGIISMLSIVACAVIYSVVKNRTFVHTILLAAMGIAWAAIMNVARISVIAEALECWGIDWSAGTSHEVLSLLLFLLTFLALLSMDQFLLVCLAPVLHVRSDQHPPEMHVGRWVAEVWDALVAFGDPHQLTRKANRPTHDVNPPTSGLIKSSFWLVLTLFALCPIVQAMILFYYWNVVGPYWTVEQRAETVAATDMPATLCDLKKTDFETAERDTVSQIGAHSRTFKYQSQDGSSFTVSFDFPFIEYWHELTVCYQGNGWEMLSRRETPHSDPSTNESWEYVEADFSKPGGEFGALYFSEFDQFGKPWVSTRDLSSSPLAFWEARQLSLKPRRVYQVQVWVTSSNAISESQKQTAVELLLAARELLRSHVTTNSNEPVPQGHADQQSARMTTASIARVLPGPLK